MADAISEDDDYLILQTMNPLNLPEVKNFQNYSLNIENCIINL